MSIEVIQVCVNHNTAVAAQVLKMMASEVKKQAEAMLHRPGAEQIRRDAAKEGQETRTKKPLPVKGAGVMSLRCMHMLPWCWMRPS